MSTALCFGHSTFFRGESWKDRLPLGCDDRAGLEWGEGCKTENALGAFSVYLSGTASRGRLTPELMDKMSHMNHSCFQQKTGVRSGKTWGGKKKHPKKAPFYLLEGCLKRLPIRSRNLNHKLQGSSYLSPHQVHTQRTQQKGKLKAWCGEVISLSDLSQAQFLGER